MRSVTDISRSSARRVYRGGDGAGQLRRFGAVRAAVGLLDMGRACLAQSRLVFPGRVTQGTPAARVMPSTGARLDARSTSGGDRIVLLRGTALAPDGTPLPDAQRRPTLLFLYGNDMCLASSLGVFEHLRRAGLNMVVPEYVGYGLSSGTPSERACYATADAALDDVMSRHDVRAAPAAVMGASLGGAVAIDLAARRRVSGLVTLVTFTSVLDLARRWFPALPSIAVRHRFESERKIARVACPTLIGHSADDGLIPPAMGDRLAAAAGGPVTRLPLDPGGGHESAQLLRAATGRVTRTIAEFVSGLPPLG